MGLFSCSIPSWFVLSNDLSTTNTRAIGFVLALFYHRLLPPDSLTTILSLHAARRDQRGQVVCRPSPAGSCLPPTAQLPKIERARSRRAGPLSHYAPNQAIPADKSIRSSPLAAAHPLDHSLVAGGAQLGMVSPELPAGGMTPWKGSKRRFCRGSTEWIITGATPISGYG